MWHEEEFDNKWQRRPKPQFFGQRGHFGCKLVKEIFNSEGASTQRAFDKNSKGTWLRHTRRPTVPSKTFSIGLLHWARSGPPAELGPIPAQKKEKHNEISFNAFSFHGKTVNEKKDRGNSVKKSLKWKESTWENVVRSMWRQQRAQTGETASEESNGDSSHALNLLPIRTPLGPTTPLPVYRFPLSTLKHNRYLFFLTTRHQQFAGANYPIFHAFSKRCRFVPSFHYLLLCFFLLLSCDIILFLSLRLSWASCRVVSEVWSERRRRERKRAFSLEEKKRRRRKMAVSKVVLMALAVLVFVVALPAVRAQSIAPAPAPTSDGQFSLLFSLFSFRFFVWFRFALSCIFQIWDRFQRKFEVELWMYNGCHCLNNEWNNSNSCFSLRSNFKFWMWWTSAISVFLFFFFFLFPETASFQSSNSLLCSYVLPWCWSFVRLLA